MAVGAHPRSGSDRSGGTRRESPSHQAQPPLFGHLTTAAAAALGAARSVATSRNSRAQSKEPEPPDPADTFSDASRWWSGPATGPDRPALEFASADSGREGRPRVTRAPTAPLPGVAIQHSPPLGRPDRGEFATAHSLREQSAGATEPQRVAARLAFRPPKRMCRRHESRGPKRETRQGRNPAPPKAAQSNTASQRFSLILAALPRSSRR